MICADTFDEAFQYAKKESGIVDDTRTLPDLSMVDKDLAVLPSKRLTKPTAKGLLSLEETNEESSDSGVPKK